MVLSAECRYQNIKCFFIIHDNFFFNILRSWVLSTNYNFLITTWLYNLIFQTSQNVTEFVVKKLKSYYLRSETCGCKDIKIRKSDFVESFNSLVKWVDSKMLRLIGSAVISFMFNLYCLDVVFLAFWLTGYHPRPDQQQVF